MSHSQISQSDHCKGSASLWSKGSCLSMRVNKRAQLSTHQHSCAPCENSLKKFYPASGPVFWDFEREIWGFFWPGSVLWAKEYSPTLLLNSHISASCFPRCIQHKPAVPSKVALGNYGTWLPFSLVCIYICDVSERWRSASPTTRVNHDTLGFRAWRIGVHSLPLGSTLCIGIWSVRGLYVKIVG